jgi:hypothetical protein
MVIWLFYWRKGGVQMRSRILALMMLTAIIVAVLVTAVGHAQNLNPYTARLCNGLPYLCEKRFDEVTFPGNHNSGSGADGYLETCYGYAPVEYQYHVRNQGKTITEQLEFGIRYFDIDTCICNDELRTCHGVWFDNKLFGGSILGMFEEFEDFLNRPENRNEVIVLTFGDQDRPDDEGLQGKLHDELLRWEPTPTLQTES